MGRPRAREAIEHETRQELGCVRAHQRGASDRRGGQAMMRLGRRASLLVAFYLLASAATASAECAWVLWTEVNQKYLRPDSPHARSNEQNPKWEFDTNVQLTRDACESQLSRKMSATVTSFTEGAGGAKL